MKASGPCREAPVACHIAIHGGLYLQHEHLLLGGEGSCGSLWSAIDLATADRFMHWISGSAKV